MNFFITLICFVFVLGITVLIHEFGHFLFAKKAGIYVYEFSIGMGPRLWMWKRKGDETEYSIRLFPIGGYVSMAGESVEEDEKIPKEKQLQSKKWYQKFLTIIAGVMFNFLLAIVIFFIVALFSGAPSNSAYIASLEENYPAMNTNLRVGDEIIGLNGSHILSTDHLLLEMQVMNGKEIELEVKHEDGTKETVNIEPVEETVDDTTTYKYGFSLTQKVRTGFLPSLQYAFQKTFSLLHQMVLIIWYLITGTLGLDSLAGPVGIFTVVGETAKMGFLNLIYLIGYLSINVGFINILPIPAFDGGRLLFLIIEKITGKPVDPKIENTIHAIGMLLLMALMIFITFNDILRLG